MTAKLLAGAAGFEPANAGTKNRLKPLRSHAGFAEHATYPQRETASFDADRGTAGATFDALPPRLQAMFQRYDEGERCRPAPPSTVSRSGRIREALSEAQNHRCAYCGERTDEPTIEHVTPRSQGGTSARSNLVMACRRCNGLRGNRDAYLFFATRPWVWRAPWPAA